jgi:hypothetical protein
VVARFLSPEWFDQLERLGEHMPADVPDQLVVDIEVQGAPGGEVRYQVVVGGGRAEVRRPGAPRRPPGARLMTDYATLAGMVSGELQPEEVLAGGRARVGGDVRVLMAVGERGGLVDLLPASLRAGTTF